MIAAQEIGDKSKDLVWIGTDGWTNLVPDLEQHKFDDTILHGRLKVVAIRKEMKP